MIRFLLRVASILLLAAAFASAVIDGTRSIAAQAMSWTPFGDACARLFPSKFPEALAFIQSHAPAWLRDPVLADVLRMPAWAVLTILGLILLRISKKRRPPIGYSNRD